MELLVYNRTHSKAQAVAAKFGGRAITMEEMTDATRLPAVDAVICVIPAKAGFELPPRLLDSKYVTSLRILVSLVCRVCAGFLSQMRS